MYVAFAGPEGGGGLAARTKKLGSRTRNFFIYDQNRLGISPNSGISTVEI